MKDKWWEKMLEEAGNVEPLEVNETKLIISPKYKELLCPNCHIPNLADMGIFWLVPDDREPCEDDEMFKCWQCWMNFTLGYIKEHQPPHIPTREEVESVNYLTDPRESIHPGSRDSRIAEKMRLMNQ